MSGGSGNRLAPLGPTQTRTLLPWSNTTFGRAVLCLDVRFAIRGQDRGVALVQLMGSSSSPALKSVSSLIASMSRVCVPLRPIARRPATNWAALIQPWIPVSSYTSHHQRVDVSCYERWSRPVEAFSSTRSPRPELDRSSGGSTRKGDQMWQTVIDLDISNQNVEIAFDDIEWELCCSAREVSTGFVQFANLDFREWRRSGRTGLKDGTARFGRSESCGS